MSSGRHHHNHHIWSHYDYSNRSHIEKVVNNILTDNNVFTPTTLIPIKRYLQDYGCDNQYFSKRKSLVDVPTFFLLWTIHFSIKLLDHIGMTFAEQFLGFYRHVEVTIALGISHWNIVREERCFMNSPRTCVYTRKWYRNKKQYGRIALQSQPNSTNTTSFERSHKVR